MSVDWEKRARIAEADYTILLQRWKEEQQMRLAAEKKAEALGADVRVKNAESVARLFHETYERLAPDFGYLHER